MASRGDAVLDVKPSFRRLTDHDGYPRLEDLGLLGDGTTAALVGLDGTVGVIANGAGLAMSTCDVVNQVGGQPANFLDIGGGANADVMANALEVINTDPKVRSIFINIFGGITKGEEVANGIVAALSRVDIKSPIVIRLDGTNADEGRAILEPHLSDRLQMQPTMLDAARTAVELAGATK
jgi:succinyl-CoA synthetase beta subunit